MDALNILINFDDTQFTISNVIENNKHIIHLHKPSIAYYILSDYIHKSLPLLEGEQLASIVWQSFLGLIPPHIRAHITKYNCINRVPTPCEFKEMNVVYDSLKSDTFNYNATYSNVPNAPMATVPTQPTLMAAPQQLALPAPPVSMINVADLQEQLKQLQISLNGLGNKLQKTVSNINYRDQRQGRNMNFAYNNNRYRRNSNSFRQPGFNRRFSPAPNRNNYMFPNRDDLCFYHKKFGNNAFTCRTPCAWHGPVASNSNPRPQNKNNLN